MKLRLKITIILLTAFFLSCSQGKKLEGNWGALSSAGDYSEITISKDKMRVYSEIGGYIGTKDIQIKEDSLIGPFGNYKVNWINKDSIVLQSQFSIHYLVKINGFSLQDFTNENENEYINSFYERMFERKGIDPDTLYNNIPSQREIKEEVIEIKRE